MMRDGRQAGFGDHFRHRQAERDMHGDGQDVFRHEHLQLEAVNKPVQLILEPLFDGLNLVSELAGTGGDIEQAALHRRHLGMVEMRQRHRMRSGGGRIQQPGHPEAGMVEPLQNMRPFARLQSDAVESHENGWR